MNVNIICIGKLKTGDIKNLIDEYLKRLPWTIKIHEHELSRPLNDDINRQEEGKLLIDKMKLIGGYNIILEERGAEMSSVDFSKKISSLTVRGISKVSFIIGGASGLSEDVRKAANEAISMSQMTFPHMMARLVLVEQIYRAFTIQNGKAYHK